MASTFEKSVKGGTKIKLAAPKSKYVEHILVATHAGEAGVAEIFRALTNRLRDSTWTIVFKGLIIVHLMIREGEPDVTLKYLSQSPGRKLAINHFTEVQTQGHNIKTYSDYLLARSKEYGNTRVDYVRNGEGRLKKLNVEKGLLRETESVQTQLRYLLRCQPLGDGEPENEITLTAFRLLTMDLLVLFHVMNEGTINVLEHYFELSKPDARRALQIYQTFCKQTETVVAYLQVARLHEHSTRLEIPKIKHAPLSLAASLEEYLNDKDFEINRRQYLAEKEAKRNGGKTTNGANKTATELPSTTRPNTASQPSAPTAPAQPPPSMPLIDLFDSIEDNQQTLGQPVPQQFVQQPNFQQPGFRNQPQQMDMGGFGQQPPQQAMIPPYAQGSNPFAQMQAPQPQPQIQTQFPGAGMGGFAPQPFSPQGMSPQGMPQGATPGFPQQQPMPSQPMPGVPMIAEPLQPQQTSTNPFRQSMMPAIGGSPAPGGLLGNPTGGAPGLSRSPTNPFAKHTTPNFPGQAQTASPTGLSSSPFSSLPPIQEPSSSPFAPQQQQQQPQPLHPAPTGTNPFARNPSPQQGPGSVPAGGGGLTVHATGSTNPFRQSAFVNQATGQGWQNGTAQGTLGGLDVNAVATTSVFPRPGQQQGGFMG